MLTCIYKPIERANSRRKARVKVPDDSPFSPITNGALASSQRRYASSTSDGADFVDNSYDASTVRLPLTPREQPAKDGTIHPLMSEAHHYPGHDRFLPSVLEGSPWLQAASRAGDVPWVGPVTEDRSEEGSRGTKAKRLAFAVADTEDEQQIIGWAPPPNPYQPEPDYCDTVYTPVDQRYLPRSEIPYSQCSYWPANLPPPSLSDPSVNTSYTASPAEGTLPSSLTDTGAPPSPYTQGLPPYYQYNMYASQHGMQTQPDSTVPLLPSSKSIERWVDFDAVGAEWSSGGFPQAEVEP